MIHLENETSDDRAERFWAGIIEQQWAGVEMADASTRFQTEGRILRALTRLINGSATHAEDATLTIECLIMDSDRIAKDDDHLWFLYEALASDNPTRPANERLAGVLTMVEEMINEIPVRHPKDTPATVRYDVFGED